MPRTFYRVVKTDPPTRNDFLSGREEGIRRPARERDVRLWEGFSVFDTFAQAQAIALKYPHHGSLIATVVIPDDTAITFERTGRNEGHHTIWGGPDESRDYVQAIRPAKGGVL